MASLYETLSDAQQGEAIAELGREFGLTPEQTQAAVESLLPAISLGLKQSTVTPEGLGDLFAIMGRQTDLHGMYSDPRAAFSREGRAAGNEVLAKMFGSPDASRAIADQAQQFSGVSSAILKKLLPILAGILISGLMRSGSGQAAPSAPQTSPDQGGGLIDILRQIFGQGAAESAGPTTSPAPSGPPPSSTDGGSLGDKLGPGRNYRIPTGGQPSPIPTDPGGQAIPGGDVFGQILTELGKAISGWASQAGRYWTRRDPHSGTSRSCRRWPTTTSAGWRHSWADLARHTERRRWPSAGAEASADERCGCGRLRRSNSKPVVTSSRANSKAFRRCSTGSSAPRAAEVANQLDDMHLAWK